MLPAALYFEKFKVFLLWTIDTKRLLILVHTRFIRRSTREEHRGCLRLYVEFRSAMQVRSTSILVLVIACINATNADNVAGVYDSDMF